MPIFEAGFIGEDGKPDNDRLVGYGPTMPVVIGHFKVAGEKEPPKEDEPTYALIDTGASQSCIDIALAEKLELPIVDVQTICGVDGAKDQTCIWHKFM